MKCVWFYLMTNCDHAGIYQVDIELMSFMIGQKVTENEIFEHLGNQIAVIKNGSDKYYLKKFVEYQYGELKDTNNAHKSVLKNLKKHNIDLGADEGLTSPTPADQDKDKVKVNNKEKKDIKSLESIDSVLLEDLQNNNLDIDVKVEFEKFKDYLSANGKRYKDYRSAFRNWLRSDFVPKTDKIKLERENKRKHKEMINRRTWDQKKIESGEYGVPDSFKKDIKKLKRKMKVGNV